MMDADQILAMNRKREPVPALDATTGVRKDVEFSVEKYRRREGASEGFRRKDEVERWGGRLSAAPRGFSGAESGTRSVIRSMNFDRAMARVAEHRKRVSEKNEALAKAFFAETLPMLVARLAQDGAPDPIMSPKERNDVLQVSKMALWNKREEYREFVSAALRHVVRKSNLSDWRNKVLKGQLVEAYHRTFGWDSEPWWKNMLEERMMKEEKKS